MWTCVVLWLGLHQVATAVAGQRLINAPELRGSFEELLQRIASAPPSNCVAPDASDRDFGNLELAILNTAAEGVATALNRDLVPADASANRLRTSVEAFLTSDRQTSARINAKWPEEARFRAETHVIPPVIVLKLGIRDQEAVFTVGYQELRDSQTKWRAWHAQESPYVDDPAPAQIADVFSIHRGPSKRARFLTRLFPSGCAGSYGVKYRLFEWDPEDSGTNLSILVSIDGSVGLERPREFPEAGKLRTDGSIITLPYCWFSVVDTWDNPSLCAADAFEVSRDEVRFRSRVVNRPDLYPIAQAIKHAKAHDYRAVRAYCRSADIARALVRLADPSMYADTLNVTRLSSSRRRVELGLGTKYHIEVERRPAGWVISRFRVIRDD